MLTEAQIEIVDEAGHVEDRVRIVGTGEVALATRGTSRLQLPSDDPAEVDAIIALRDGMVTVEVKRQQVLRVDDTFLPVGKPRDVQRQLVALIAAVRRHLHVRTVVVPTSSMMSPGGVVIRYQPSELERWASAAAARGPLPEDMNPESKTDL
jgi:hypothetical protein